MRRLSPLLTLALISACATPQPPKRSASRITVQPPAPPPKPPQSGWQPAAVKADGAAVPGGRRHIVKRGETGLAIAKAYGVPWGRITAANKLDRDSVIQVGQALFIPIGAPPQQASRTQPGQPTTGQSRPTPPRTAPSGGFALDVDDAISGSAPAAEAGAARPQVPPTQAAATVPQLSWPVDGRVILSRYGPKAGGRFNDGINIKTTKGATVRAAADGEVVYVGDAITGFGLMILIRHPGGTVSAYGHLEDALVDRGTKVQRGQPIARAGTSGSANEPQLHFQLRQGRRTLDPVLYLPR
ncbi:M23 family metallopeptidase [Sandaracinobacter neustonicus]|uniref:M23 family metallopeptidase n=1 Tax=Sandaracinobacter neustonicus TaxID=1715348 RepID=A0A501XF55_9SPHN|nr:M23 family metallopeptidase [Sandaracinobacter neustonicus]TPE59192.1 M23 family metallopeptidase [Sandaracinobacter neustonicus]